MAAKRLCFQFCTVSRKIYAKHFKVRNPYVLYSLTPRSGRSHRSPRPPPQMLPPIRNHLSPIEAVRIIETAYLKYKLRLKIAGLARRLQKSVKKRESFMKLLQQQMALKKPLKRSTCAGPLSFRSHALSHAPSLAASIHSSFDNLLLDGSLYHLEHESVLVFGGINVHSKYGIGRNTGKDIYRYLPVANTWEFVGELPAPRTHHCVAFLNGRIYVVGGSDPREDDVKGKFMVVDTVWSFDPVKRAWFSEGGLNLRRKNFGLVVVGQYMYAIGGQDKNSRVTDTMERYDPTTGTWDYMAPMRHPRMGCACAKFEEKIWVGGGMCGSSHAPLTDFVEVYDVATNQWTDMPRLRVPRCFAAFSALSNNLYLIAGAGRAHNFANSAHHVGTVSLASVDQWNARSGKWEEHAQMEVARHGHTTAYLGTQILIVGGVTTVYMRSLSSIECFCTTRGTWIRGMASLPNCLTGHATCTLPPAMIL